MTDTLIPAADVAADAAAVAAPASPKPVNRAGRGGGRAARHALRSSPLADDVRPIRPGLKGGHYKPLSAVDVDRIHQAALTALEQIGLADAPPSGVAILTGAGAVLGDDGRIRFPRALVEDMLALAARNLTVHGRDAAQDLHLTPGAVHYGTAGAAVMHVDPVTRSYRPSTVADLHQARGLPKAWTIYISFKDLWCVVISPTILRWT